MPGGHPPADRVRFVSTTRGQRDVMGHLRMPKHTQQYTSSAANLKQVEPSAREEAQVRRLKAQLLQAKEATADTFKPQRLRTPLPVEGRHHVQLQTEQHLIELTEKTQEFMAETQTDPWIDRPDTPMFRPHKEETHASTQIQDGDLFNFDEEVVPILEVIIGKVLEQSFCEVIEEEELAAIREEQEKFERIRAQEVIEYQRLAAAEKRRQEEMERRLAQTKAWQEVKRSAWLKVLASDYGAARCRGRSRFLLHQIASSTGLFLHPTVGAVSGQFWPDLMNQTLSEVSQRNNFTDFAVSALLPAWDRPQREKEVAMAADVAREQKLVLNARLDQIRLKAEMKARLEREEAERQEMEHEDNIEEQRNFELAEAERLAQAQEAPAEEEHVEVQGNIDASDKEDDVTHEEDVKEESAPAEDPLRDAAELQD